MCTCFTKSGPKGENAVGEKQLQTWHALRVHTNVCRWGKIQGFKGFNLTKVML